MTELGNNSAYHRSSTMKAMSGLEFLRAHRRRHAAGAADRRRRSAFTLAEVSQGYARFEMTPAVQALQSDRRRARRGGGDAARQLHELRRADACCRPAPATRRWRSRSTSCAPLTDKTGPIRAEGRTLHVGRRAGTAEGKILDANGTLYAHGTTTCMIFPL